MGVDLRRIAGIVFVLVLFVMTALFFTFFLSPQQPGLINPRNLIDTSVTPFISQLNEEKLKTLPSYFQSAKTTSLMASTSQNFSEATSHPELTLFILDFGSEEAATDIISDLRDSYNEPDFAPYGSMLMAEADGFSLYKTWVNGHCIHPASISYIWQHEHLVFIVGGHDFKKVEFATLSILGRFLRPAPEAITAVRVISTGIGHECRDWLGSGEITCRSTRQTCL